MTLSQNNCCRGIQQWKRKVVSIVSLEVKWQWKQRCLQFQAKQLQWWRSPDRRRQAVPGACSRYREGAVAKCDASRWSVTTSQQTEDADVHLRRWTGHHHHHHHHHVIVIAMHLVFIGWNQIAGCMRTFRFCISMWHRVTLSFDQTRF